MADKKLIATTVSSREKGIRRREEGETTSSQRMISLQGNQEESRKNLMKDDDDSPTHTRNKTSPCVHSKRPVCTGTTRTCFSTCARVAGIHWDVSNVYMEAF